jgi:hypothetical protein
MDEARMNVKDAASKLNIELRSKYTNIQSIGVVENNSESYAKNPKMFSKEITEDSLIVYTTTKPDKKQTTLTSYEGFKVEWICIGKIVVG